MKNNEHLTQATQKLIDCVQQIFNSRSSVSFSREPKPEEKDIIEYESRMRVFGPEKFNNPCFISVINLYRNETEKKENLALGAIVLYVDEDHVDKILKALGLPFKETETEEEVMTTCADMATLFLEKFKGELSALGYSGLVASETKKYKSLVSEGIEFNYDENKFSEIDFYLWKNKIFTLNLTIAPPS